MSDKGIRETISQEDCCEKREWKEQENIFDPTDVIIVCVRCAKRVPNITLSELVKLGWTEANASALWWQEAKKGMADYQTVDGFWLNMPDDLDDEDYHEPSNLATNRIILQDGRLPELESNQVLEQPPAVCGWMPLDKQNVYGSKCGVTHKIPDDVTIPNHLTKFCPTCGRKIAIVAQEG